MQTDPRRPHTRRRLTSGRTHRMLRGVLALLVVLSFTPGAWARSMDVPPGAGSTWGSGVAEQPGSVIVAYDAGARSAAERSAASLGAKQLRRARTGGFTVFTVPAGMTADGLAGRLAGLPGVRYAEPNDTIRALVTPTDPDFSLQWGMTRIGGPDAWDVERGAGTVVAVVDTGVDLAHPEFVGRLDTVNDYDFINDDTTAQDDEGHGTHVAGIVAAALNNTNTGSKGVVGAAPAATILPLKVLAADGTGTADAAADAIRWAADKGAGVINMSLGSKNYSQTVDEAVQYAVGKDVVVVAATGNDGKRGVQYPAALPNVIGVASTTSTDARSSFSNYGPGTDICAPGSVIYSTLWNAGSTYGYASGTSMATPHVAGVVALIRSQNPTWTRTQVEARLIATAEDLGVAGYDEYFGHGLVQADAAVGAPLPPPNTAPVAAADAYATLEDTAKVVAAPGVLGNDTDADAGDTLTAVKETDPSHGTVALSANGAFTYTPDPDWYGTDTFTYRAYDGELYSAPATVSITVQEVNDPPVAAGDSYTTSVGTPKTVAAPGVLANDTDVEGDTLTAVEVGGPAHGTLELAADGSFTYVPVAGFTGTDTFTYRAHDGSLYSDTVTVTITVSYPPLAAGAMRVEGPNRYATSVAASVRGFPSGAATVVVATGANWPDALGGSALAGAVDGPLLLTKPDVLPSEVWTEIDRLDATKAYILGSADAVSSAVESYLKAKGLVVARLGGANRYDTARLVADETIRLLGPSYQGHAFVATGMNFPDATGAAPVAAALGRPILLANVSAGTVSRPPAVKKVAILGSVAAVPSTIESALKTTLGSVNVTRLAGANRYATAAMAAQLGVDAGMRWDGTGIATGLNFPDALSGGAMLGKLDSVMLLTRPDTLAGEARTKLYNNRSTIDTLFIFGDTNAVSIEVESAATAAATVK